MNFLKKFGKNLKNNLEDGFDVTDITDAIIDSADGATRKEKKKHVMNTCKIFGKHLFKGYKQDGFQLKDITDAVKKTIDGGRGEQPYRKSLRNYIVF